MLLEPLHSIVNFPFYRQVAERSLGRAVGYVFYLGFLFSTVATLALYLKLSPLLQESIEWAAQNVPTLTFADGKAASSSPAPVTLQHPRAPSMSVHIDTSRTSPVSAQEMREAKWVVVLTQNTLYVRSNAEKIEQHDLSAAKPQKPVVMDRGFYQALGRILNYVLFPAAWLASWAFFVPWKLLAGLVYSLIGLAVNAATSAGLEFAHIYKIAVYAQTPVVLMQAAMLFLPRPMPGFFFIAFLVASVYVWQGVRQNHAAAPA